MKRICLITHTEATHTFQNKVGGWFDSELTHNGKEQALFLERKITDLGFDLNNCPIYSSDLKRAYQTASIIYEPYKREVLLDSRLREMSFGSHEGIDQNDHNSTMIPASPYGNRMDHRICKGAESRRDLATRLVSFVEEIIENEQNALIVTHGFAATFFIAAFQKIDIEQMGFINYKLNPGSITILEADDLFENRSVSLLNG